MEYEKKRKEKALPQTIESSIIIQTSKRSKNIKSQGFSSEIIGMLLNPKKSNGIKVEEIPTNKTTENIPDNREEIPDKSRSLLSKQRNNDDKQ